MKIIINKCFGGFEFSSKFIDEYKRRTGIDLGSLDNVQYRCANDVVELFEEWGSERASGVFARLKIVEIPDGVDWEIQEYDGVETICERHRRWH